MKWIIFNKQWSKFLMILSIIFLQVHPAKAQECNPDDLYDAIVSAYHQSFAKKSDGSWSAWGQLMAPNGTGAVLSPQDVNSTNYPAMTGVPLLASTASGGSGASEQSVLLTTTGLFVWGAENVIVNTSLTSSAAFQALTIGGNTNGLPSGVLPTDVHQLFANNGALSILTNSGALYVLGINGIAHPAMLGDATATVDQTWHRVKTNSTTFLSNVVAVRGHNASSSKGAMMALCYNGVSYTAYTWGPSAYLGAGGATASYNYATLMTLPSGTPKMIGVTGGNSSTRNSSYFVLMTSGSLFSLGANDVKQLGDFSTTERRSWVNVKRTASANFTDVKFISAQEHDAKYPSAAIITNAGDLYVWGENNGNMLGAADGTYDPFLPGGFTSGTDVAKFVEVGGHTTVYVKENSAKFCYVGHRTNGSMGDGTSTSTNETTFNCSATPNINICGSTGWDYGDAPVAYENGGGSNLAFHFYVSSPNSIYLGASGPISNDDTPKNVVLATDNNGSLGDGTEENSVATFPALGTSATTYSFNITMKNSLGSNAYLYVWVDWNNNRRFESTEIYTTTVSTNASVQSKTATFSGLSGLTEGRRYVRIRLTSQALTDVAGTTNWDERALGFASDGEMEDFNLVIGSLTGANVPPTTSNLTHSGVILSSDDAMDIDNPVGADSDGSVVAYRVISLPTKGTLYKLVGLSLFNVALNQAITAEEANSLNYDPSGLSEGIDSFQLAAIDDDGAEDATPATYTINISCSADTDGDGICDADEVPGCTDPSACNYNSSATDNNGTCTYPTQTYLNCAGNCINDTDNDGVCNELEVPGCTDPTACNYNALATDENASCTYPTQTYLNCAGNCINDTDNDGVCNELEIPGCTNVAACNYEELATDDNGSCILPINEICNGLDDNCDGEVDEYVTLTYYADNDGDGFGDLNTSMEACTLPNGYADNSEDCDDAIVLYEDLDGDGLGTVIWAACGVVGNGDCDDTNSNIYLGAQEICGNGIDEDCNGQDEICVIPGCTDQTACNYNASANQEDGTCTYPAQTYLTCEGTCINDTDNDGVCNEIEVPGCTDEAACNYNASATDDNGSCSYASLTYYVDGDGDGFGAGDGALYCSNPGEGFIMDNTDCDDANAAINTSAVEVCNLIDDDCDGEIDEYVTTTYYADLDGDGFGDLNNAIESCTLPEGYSENSDDCDDAMLTYLDADGDGNGSTTADACGVGSNDDCDDSSNSVNVVATEICGNGIDENCDGLDDVCIVNGCMDALACNYNASANQEDGTCTYPTQTYLTCEGTCINDTDGDGVCNELEIPGCTDPSACNYDENATDEDASCTYPTVAYLNCSGECINDSDNDGICNEEELAGCTDEAACNFNATATDDDGSCTYASLTYYVDGDGDGFGSGDGAVYCTDPGEGFTMDNSDCDDSNALISPSAIEVCNGVDDDCDIEVDEFVTNTYYADADGDGFGNATETIEACELPDGYTNNQEDCDDGLITFQDLDGDGMGSIILDACGSVSNEDCDDTNDGIFLGAEELCGNGIDEDCDGQDLTCPIQGCMDPTACNYDALATYENGTCTYPTQTYLTCEGTCINDTDGDGVCNEIEVPGCMDPTACNFDEFATDNNGSCNYPSLTYYIDADGDGYGSGVATLYCADPGAGYVTNGDDCNDSNIAIYLGANEICGNGIDEDCNGSDFPCPIPIANNDSGSMNEDETVTINLLSNDNPNSSTIDPASVDLDPNTPGIQTNITTAEGVWSVDGLGVVTFTPIANFNGNASLNYNVSDVLGNVSNSATINITVNPINDAPQGPSSVTESTPYETPATVCIDPSLVIDIDGDAVSVTGVVVDPSNGVVSGLNDGDLCFTYVPNANFTGVDSMLVTICDNGTPSLCDTVWAYVLIGGSSPIAVDDYLNSNNGTVSIDVVLNDQIPGNVGYTVSVADSTQNGTIVINGSLVSYTPNFGFCGVDSMSYSICNDMGMCDTAMLIIDVTPADADLDGISDYYETLDADVDADGVPNYLDEDSDNDGVSDAEEAGTSSLCDANFKDCDQDGTPDYLDFFTCGVSLEIPEGFSPNGDNTNDTWVIPGVEEFPENTMTVFNRWGARVYTKAPYDNSWDGTSSENTIGSNLLPEGTYFFVFTTGPNGETKNGYVYIKR